MKNSLSIDLTNLEIADVQVLNQEAKGMPEFAASCCTGSCCTGSCTQDPAPANRAG